MNKIKNHPLLLLLLPLPFIYFLFSFYFDIQRLGALQARIETLNLKTLLVQKQKQTQNEMIGKIKNADHFFIDKHLESLNGFRFSEEVVRTGEGIQEVEEVQIHPVQVDDEDLKRILSVVESVQIGPYTPLENSPQLIIKQFNLTKKSQNPQESIFILNMQLIKREPL